MEVELGAGIGGLLEGRVRLEMGWGGGDSGGDTASWLVTPGMGNETSNSKASRPHACTQARTQVSTHFSQNNALKLQQFKGENSKHLTLPPEDKSQG